MQESNVAPPQHSTEKYGILSISGRMGRISSMVMRVASRDWWASRRTTSVILMGFLANVIHPAFLLVHGDEQVAGVDNVALAHIDAGNGAVLRGADLVLHLHGLED